MPGHSASENKSMKVLSAERAAEIIIDGMERNKYRVLVGKDASFMDFLYRINPRSAAAFISKKMQSLLAG
jgi:short-subunit dehydrogenase